MKKEKLIPILTIGCSLIVLLITGPFRTYKYHKENTDIKPETEATDPFDDSTLNDEMFSDADMNSQPDMTSADESFSQGNAPSDMEGTSVLSVSDNETTLEGDSEMINPDRIIYHEGFYYEPLSEEIKARIYGLSYKEDCTVPYEELRYVSVLYKNFDNETAYGELICNKAIAQDLVEIFYELFQNDYQIEKIRLIDEYNADDDISCQENNTSCFNYRVVAGSTTLSKHALGLAIDINPFYNPYVTYPDGVERISPPGSEPYANRDANLPHMIQKGDLIYNLFTEHGFTWGGEWNSLKDYQHFQKAQ